jgi:hypothetical protein
MAELNQVRIQILNAETGAVIDTVDVKTSDNAVYLPDGSTLRSWINVTDDALAELQQKIAAHLAKQHVDPAKVNSLLTGITFNEQTGVFTITAHDGSETTIDTLLEKVTVNFTLVDGTEEGGDADKTYLVLTAEDGTTQKLDVTKLIDVYQGSTGTEINVSVSADKKISAALNAASITEDKLSEAVKTKLNATYSLPKATTSTLGGVIVGNGLAVDENGKISAANVKNADGDAVSVQLGTDVSTAVITVTGPADSVVSTTVGTAVSALTVTASITGDAAASATATYQWYKKVVGTDVAFSAISGATAATLAAANIDVASAGTTIYYCCVGATGSGVVADSVTSKRVTVVVSAA